ncbi:MAG: hypothetical protein AAF357_04535 [Verrucomicrobiota bacterium]
MLWIFSEDLSPYLDFFGDPIYSGHVPTIEAMAEGGVLFVRAPVCPSERSAIITGVMQTKTGTHQHCSSRSPDGSIAPEDTRIHLPEGLKTILEPMRNTGYFTFNTGKDDYNFHYDARDILQEAAMAPWEKIGPKRADGGTGLTARLLFTFGSTRFKP